jgi:acyl transferase domain-containing protein/acyl carrier protein
MSVDPKTAIVVVGMACRVPGADSVEAFADMLFNGRTGYSALPADRCDRSLYFDPQKGKAGKSYTTLGGTVPERPLNRDLCPLSTKAEQLFDAAHVQFAEVAATAWRNAELVPQDARLTRTGVYVGHSGGTKSGGGLSLGTQIEEALSFVDDIESFHQLPANVRREIVAEVSASIRRDRPSRKPGALPSFHAYQAASLSARILGLTGPRAVIDAACASSLVALAQAMLAIKAGRIDSAIVGGATYNNIDNLILFSHSQACTATDSRPFDDHASGLVSSEGYVAIVVMTQAKAIEHDLPILGVIRGVGMASDGKGRSLWAPRMEGQVLALQRAYGDAAPLDIDYLEAHATSTQLGDATELETLRRLSQHPQSPVGRHQLLLGSVKSNIGHTLEAAGLIGMVKVLTAMQRRQVPPSLRYEQPNRNYDWATAPVRVVSRTEPWPQHALHSRPRRAAVSAFGIGGLNAHVVVEEAGAGMSPMRSGTVERPRVGDTGNIAETAALSLNEPIAIIGRGIIVAGAKNLQEFKSLLESNRSALSDAPDSRWRKRAGVTNSATPVTHHTPHCRGGFITDFTFNGSKYAIPPKQVQQANPVQLMLIDAVTQALADVNSESTRRAGDVNPLMIHHAGKHQGTDVPRSPEKSPFDRQRIGVVVGTIFGGEFGDQLQVGMRLPEICEKMSTAMQQRGLPNQLSQQITTEFRQIVLKNRPALLDETGSFTASTLASRVAKTFDLMGGACALDSDDTSGLTALSVAADQLRSGTSDMIVCGSAQRSMSLSAFEALDMNGQLVRSGRSEDIPDNCNQILPGEGVVALILCRLSDAKRLDLPIHGILGDVIQSNRTPAQPSQSVRAITTALVSRSTDVLNSADARIIRKIGYLAGAHSLVRIAAETLLPQKTFSLEPQSTITIAAQTTDGVVLQAPLSIPFANADVNVQKQPELPVYTTPMTKQVSFPMTTAPMRANVANDDPLQRVRFAATSGASLLRLLKDAGNKTAQIINDQRIIRETEPAATSPRNFAPGDQFRATILFASVEQLQQRLAAAIKAAEAGRFNTLLDRERVILWKTSQESPRVAWLFPGQGSHYPETPAVLSASDIARQTLAEVDDLYAASNLPRLSTAFDNATVKPGIDVWWAQAWVLGVSAALIRALKSQGLHPDAVLGHSFGEFTASLAANVTTLPQTIELAKHRANAVISHMRVPGGLLSIRAAVHEVDAIMKPAGLDVYVTHLNSTKQTVIAGSRDGIASAKALLDKNGLASMSVSVPAPFHTPLMADAEVAFEQLSSNVTMRPPVCGFLSATCVQYLAEPSAIRRSLVRQLTQPVMFMPSIQRMMGEGYRVFLEVGPNDVLTRMNRDIVDDSAVCLSLDVPGQPFAERMQLVRAVLECVTSVAGQPIEINASTAVSTELSQDQSTNPVSAVAAEETVFDVTRLRRAGRKSVLQPEEAGVQTSDFVKSFNGHDRIAQSPSLRFIDGISSAQPAAITNNGASDSVTSSNSTVSDEQLRSFVLDLVVELTGYSPDVVDFDADLEAHLGIDSIKKAQILGELGVWLGMTVRPDGMRFDSVRTLDDAIRTVRTLATEEDISTNRDSAVSSSFVAAATPMSSMIQQTAAIESRGLLPSNAQLDALLIDYVIDQTGYTPDIVDLDADLEADLGLDSIKLAQLIGQMREQFNLQSLTLESIGQNRFRTLRAIREFLVRHTGTENVADSPGVATGRVSRSVETRSNQDSTGVPSHEKPSYVTSHIDQSPRGIKPISEITPEWSNWFNTGSARPTSVDAAMQTGLQQGQRHRSEIRAALRTLVNQQSTPAKTRDWSSIETAQFSGIAVGAGVAEASVQFAASVVHEHLHPAPLETISPPDKSVARTVFDVVPTKTVSSQQTQRFALRVVPAPRRAGMPLDPKLHGAALILGANPLAEAIAARIRELGQTAIVINTNVPIAALEKSLADLWQQTATPHLFLTMAFDANSARELSEAVWKHRRPAALEVPFRICQLWMQRTIDADQMENACVIAATQLGGDFGFSGQHVGSFEAIGGLVKAMLIEAWMRGFRTTPMKVIDLASNMPTHVASRGILQELAVPSYDMEIAFRGTQTAERLGVQAVPAPLSDNQQHPVNRITRGGTWIVSGGGRGITAVIAMTLAKKYDLKLHLLGTAPVPNLSDDFVARVATDRSSVRNSIMQQSQSRGESPVEGWRNVEKAIEVDATLRDCKRQGITATYHSCDVSDFSDVAAVIRAIRQQAGPIAGVLHGAGAGQDSRFDRKRPDKVEKCLRAKIDGTIALMQATQSDPLEWFVTFGSISGRFGANGHTDYSLANDMMAKIIDRYRSQRPDVRSLTFHWHAWGDIGMATKPEAKLALEMIDMEFMPARDGIAHFMRELESGGDEPEVLITDESYFRKFFPAERLSLTSSEGNLPLPLLPSTVTQHGNGVCSSVVTLNPVTDRFLSQHRVQNRPTLPFVVALELMAEAVRARTGQSHAGVCTSAVAKQAIRFATDDPLAVTVQTRSTGDGKIECRLLADVRRRDGRMVEEDREYFRATFDPSGHRIDSPSGFDSHVQLDKALNWTRVQYVSPEALIYHGPELQELREVADDGRTIYGKIAASAPVQLFGGSRARGYSIPCATMDACLYAIGHAAWHRHKKPSLPVQFGRIEFGRLPDPGEPCVVRIHEKQIMASGAVLDFQLYGNNGDRLLIVCDYQIGWLKGS